MGLRQGAAASRATLQRAGQRAASNVSALPTHAGFGERRITRTAPQGAPEGVRMTQWSSTCMLSVSRRRRQQAMSAVSEFPDLPSLESQLRQHATDLPLRVISTVWASNSSYHPWLFTPESTRVAWKEIKVRTARARTPVRVRSSF